MGRQEKSVEFEVDFQYENADRNALQNAAGSIEKGKCIVLCGSSGCGKSTLLRCMNQLIPQFYEGELKGFCRIGGEDIRDLSIGEVGMRASSVFQDPRSQFFTLNSSTEAAFGLENFGVSHDQMVRRVDRAFREFHLEHLKSRNVSALSSGERQLIAILSAWAVDTDIFLLDEPTANLDSGAIRQLQDLLLALREQGKTLIISEHRLYYLKDIGDEYWVMQEGRIREKISAEEMEDLPEYRRKELCLRTADIGKVELEHPVQTDTPEVMHRFSAEEIRYRYQKTGQWILNGFSLEVHTGEVVGIIGTNGSGKTTFGKCAAGLYSAVSGNFLLDGKQVPYRELSRHCIFIMQEAEYQFFTNSVWNELAYGQKKSPETEKKIEALLKSAGMWELRNQHPFSLSGGQMQKLVLLLACLSPKPLVILDEPTAGLDYGSLQSCGTLIEEMKKTKMVLIITHDLELIAKVCTRCAAVEQGKIGQKFDLMQEGQFQNLKKFTENLARIPEKVLPPGKNSRLLDPRIKLFLMLLASVVGIWTDVPLIFCTFGIIAAAAVYERKWSILLWGGSILGVLLGWDFWFPGVGASFALHFFPRIVLIGGAAALLVQQQEAPRTLAALRKLHIPERVIMICSVIFRFFPVLHADLKIMAQSIKTRGFFPAAGEKIRAIPEYLEIMIVPMVFRVMRIAEALSASAETRGIALKIRRDSYIALKFGAADGWMLFLTAIMIAAGIIL